MAKIMIGKHEGTIYPEGDGFTGAISLGFGPDGKRLRLKRKGRTKAEVKDKLIKAVKDLEAGITSPDNYLVRGAVEDWLTMGLKGRSEKTITTLRIMADKHVNPLIGKTKVKLLRADDVDAWLDGLTDKLSTRSLQTIHSILKRAIRHAQARDMVLKNVAELVTTPKGRAGRPSKSLTFVQATAVLEAAKSSPLHTYVVLSLMTGVRTEEARALRWDHIVAWVEDVQGWRPVTEAGFDHKKFAIYVWRAERVGGDTKTPKSRRTLELPRLAAQALRRHHKGQAAERLAAGKAWQDHGLVFCTTVGTPWDAANVRRSFRAITKNAGIGEEWTPRELRHSFVSIMSDNDVPIETIADLVGHAGTRVTEQVYRHQLKPVITRGAETMNTIFGDKKKRKPKSA
ncbi:site-specific integrase [Acrocarpospora macrocephala]|uniref:Site-specific integrase n=1 Tax=Acrocarpospora macrocephala TaxID=150177 RepID=A0A5M3WMX0_9ACTN|nr:site-specific integrase [Acrocarpospora macrocephala]GES07658.1 site-specific integrase [Acrocarpospora macrocephala]